MAAPSFARLARGKKVIAAVITHTHWDRAWYHPAEQFRLSLCRITRRLLDILENDRRYSHFTFDGQTVVLEDYLELYPEDRPRIEKLVRAGRLTYGPFYVLPDTFLISGESMIRNGMIGQEMAERLGRSSRQGYVADPFGLISQLPQIFAGLGLQSVFFSRGMSKAQLKHAGAMFHWAGPDGKSRILGVLQVEGYSNVMNWGVPLAQYPRKDPDTDKIDFIQAELPVNKVLASYKKFGIRSRVLYFGNGNDHHGPQHKLPEIMAHCARKFPQLKFTLTDTDGFVDLVAQEQPRLRTLSGEMHQQGTWGTLNATLDSRPYLKQQYDEAADWIERRAEPLAALTDRLGLSQRVLRQEQHVGFAFNVGNCAAHHGYPHSALRYAWKTLLRNAPHDDICGCSVDATHLDAENRAKRVVEVAALQTSDAALRLASSIQRPIHNAVTQLLVWNGLGHQRLSSIDRTLRVPANSTQLRLLDETGTEVPVTLRARVMGSRFKRWHNHYFEKLPQKEIEVRLAFSARLPALGYRTFYLQEQASALKPAPGVRRLAAGMENDFVRVELKPDGSFDLFDKRSRRWYRRQHQLRDQGDAGSLYESHILADGVRQPRAQDGRLRLIEALADRVTFEVRLRLPRVPLGVSEDRKKRSSASAPLAISFLFTLFSHSPALHIRAEWTNAHADHRLTVDFPTGLKTRNTEAGSTFDVVPHRAPFMQESCRDFVTAAGADGRVTLLSRSMHSYDARVERGRLVLSKCLLKASGHVYTGVLPYWSAPGGNCLRPLVQEYAFMPGLRSDGWDALSRAAAEFASAPFVDHYLWPATGALPSAQSLVSVTAPFEVSACKRAERGGSLIVRVLNMSGGRARGRLRLSPLLQIRKGWLTDLRERRLTPLAVRDGELLLAARSRDIMTVELA